MLSALVLIASERTKMQKKIPLSLSVLIILFAMLVTFMGTFVCVSAWAKEQYTSPAANEGITLDEGVIVDKDSAVGGELDLSALNEIKEYFDNYYVGEIDNEELVKYMISGYVVGTGDEYAHYYDAEGYAAMMDDLGGDMQGIGVSVIYNPDYNAIEVINVFPDSPAIEAGVEVGDLILFVGEENESVAEIGYNMAVKKMQGKAGTVAKFVAYRGKNYTEEIAFEIPREFITEQTVTYRLYDLDKTVGVIKISAFDGETVNQFKEALEELQAQGATKLVFDLRNNPGGEKVSICTILDMLLPKGPVIRAVDKTGIEQVLYVSDEKELDIPMAVVVNSNTASAAELFSSALQDYDKAEIVGTVTYGKGCMQTIFPLSNGGCLSMTTAMYLPPFSDNYNEIGVKPDVEVELSEEAAKKNIYKLTDEEDNQLAAAVATFDK